MSIPTPPNGMVSNTELILRHILGEDVTPLPPNSRVEFYLMLVKDLIAQLQSAVNLKGETTTPLTDNATTNPIMIDGKSYTAVMNDAVIYQSGEFIFDGTKWHELGDVSNLTAANISAMTGYSKPSETSAIVVADTLNAAIGKLEKALDLKQSTIDSDHKLSTDNVDDSNATNKFATAEQLSQIETNKNNISSITDITKQQTTSLYFGTNAGKEATEASSGDNGKYNCAVGTRAMQSNTQGDHCTALGFQAMYKNTTGDGNTAIGEDALYENTTGTSNTVVGAHALQNCTGSGNVAIGTSSLQNDTTGFYNVAVGQDAGKGVTVGQKNIFIGANCKANSDISNSIFIGADIASATSNLCVIGNASITKTIVRGDFVVRDTQGTRRQLVFNQDGTVSWIEVQ